MWGDMGRHGETWPSNAGRCTEDEAPLSTWPGLGSGLGLGLGLGLGFRLGLGLGLGRGLGRGLGLGLGSGLRRGLGLGFGPRCDGGLDVQHGRGVGEREEHIRAQLEAEVRVAARAAAPGGAAPGGGALVVGRPALAGLELQLAHAHDDARPQLRPLAQPAHLV